MKAKTAKHAFTKKYNYFRNKTHTGLRKFIGGKKATKKNQPFKIVKLPTKRVEPILKFTASPKQIDILKSPTKKKVLSKNDVLINEKFNEIASTVEETRKILSKYDVKDASLREEQLKTLKVLLLNKVSYVNVWKNMKENSLLSDILSEKQQAVDPRAVMMDQCIWIGNASAKIPSSNIVSFCVPNHECVHTVCFSLNELTEHIKKYKKDAAIPNIWAEEIKTKIPEEFHKHVNLEMDTEWVDYIKMHQRISNINDITKQLNSGDMAIFNWLCKMLVKFTQLNTETLFVGSFIKNIHSYVPSFVANSKFFKFSTNVLERIYNNPSWMFVLLVLTKAIRLFICMLIEGANYAKIMSVIKYINTVFTGQPLIQDILNICFSIYDCYVNGMVDCLKSLSNTTIRSVGSFIKIVTRFTTDLASQVSFIGSIMTKGDELISWAYRTFRNPFTIIGSNTFIEYLKIHGEKMHNELLMWTFLYHFPATSFTFAIGIVTALCPATMGLMLIGLTSAYNNQLLLEKINNPHKQFQSMGEIIRKIMKELSIFRTLYQIVIEIKDWLKMLYCWLTRKTKPKLLGGAVTGKQRTAEQIERALKQSEQAVLSEAAEAKEHAAKAAAEAEAAKLKAAEEAAKAKKAAETKEAAEAAAKAKKTAEAAAKAAQIAEQKRINAENENRLLQIAADKIKADRLAEETLKKEHEAAIRLAAAREAAEKAAAKKAAEEIAAAEAKTAAKKAEKEAAEKVQAAINAEQASTKAAIEFANANEATKLLINTPNVTDESIQQHIQILEEKSNEAKTALSIAQNKSQSAEEAIRESERVSLEAKTANSKFVVAVGLTEKANENLNNEATKYEFAHTTATIATEQAAEATKTFTEESDLILEKGKQERTEAAKIEAEAAKKEAERQTKIKNGDPAALQEEARRKAEKEKQENERMAIEKSEYCCFENALYEFVNLKEI